MSTTIGHMTIRCNTCGQYYTTTEAPESDYLLRCPNKHFSQFTIISGLVVNAHALAAKAFIKIAKRLDDDTLRATELQWLSLQTEPLYDCGFIHNPKMLPELPLIRPNEDGLLEDEIGNIFTLVVSPNGVPYYKKEKR